MGDPTSNCSPTLMRGFGGGWTYAPLSRQWDLDMLGNWRELRYDVTNGSSGLPNGVFEETGDAEETRTHNLANEITARTPNGLGALDFTNDHASNTRNVLDGSDDGTLYTHDAWNRLVRVQTVDGGSTLADVARYQYNGLHWRTYRDNGVDERDLFYYSSDWQLIEEHRYAYSVGNPLPGTLSRIAQQFRGLRHGPALFPAGILPSCPTSRGHPPPSSCSAPRRCAMPCGEGSPVGWTSPRPWPTSTCPKK